jgi:hypothetical protein
MDAINIKSFVSTDMLIRVKARLERVFLSVLFDRQNPRMNSGDSRLEDVKSPKRIIQSIYVYTCNKRIAPFFSQTQQQKFNVTKCTGKFNHIKQALFLVTRFAYGNIMKNKMHRRAR